MSWITVLYTGLEGENYVGFDQLGNIRILYFEIKEVLKTALYINMGKIKIM